MNDQNESEYFVAAPSFYSLWSPKIQICYILSNKCNSILNVNEGILSTKRLIKGFQNLGDKLSKLKLQQNKK